MPHTIYSKPFKNEDDLIIFLKSKKLPINDESKAKKLLKDISYYRFKSYMHPFKDLNKEFNGSVSFEDIEQLYRFDDELRDVFFSIIGRIEIKVRSKLNYVITKFTNNPYWYLDENLFNSKQNHNKILLTISNYFLNSKADYVKHYQDNYVNDKNNIFKHLPPFWIVGEIIMFGELLNICKNLEKNQFNNRTVNILDELSKEFGALHISEFNKWLILIKAIRNDCAHHSRLWNNTYFAPRGLVNPMDRLTIRPLNPNRIYAFFTILHIISKKLPLKDVNIYKTIKDLMQKYPIFDNQKALSGFPTNWDSDPFWH
ncbi:Abi family protein [Aliarcobacter skirrowii]|uniref:Abi family protein n=1 Tax=Aliarcobacter skirrowii TaxID=28200 RepID=UPI002A35CB25|nr:Abi family protein [Aliarcobacter skirrowii]MDY0180599.1 Abi family protein [Aliarcobacter skirrowii]